MSKKNLKNVSTHPTSVAEALNAAKLAYEQTPANSLYAKFLENHGYAIHKLSSPSSVGYSGISLLNKQKGILLIAHRGTDDTKDITTDAQLAHNLDINQMNDAMKFTRESYNSLTSEQKGTGISVFYTGHSLGAFLAQASHASLLNKLDQKHNSMITDVSSATFDNPGAKEYISKNFPSHILYQVGNHTVAFNAPANSVNTANDNFGVYEINFTKMNCKVVLNWMSCLKDKYGSFFGTGVNSHFLDNFVNEVNPKTDCFYSVNARPNWNEETAPLIPTFDFSWVQDNIERTTDLWCDKVGWGCDKNSTTLVANVQADNLEL